MMIDEETAERLRLQAIKEKIQTTAVEKAQRWTAAQAERLGVSPQCIVDGILAGHLPEEISKMVNRHPLGYPPDRIALLIFHAGGERVAEGVPIFNQPVAIHAGWGVLPRRPT